MKTPSAHEIREAIVIVNDSRYTHLQWIAAYAAGFPLDQTAGDSKHHQVCVQGYDKVLRVLGRLL